MTPSCPTRRSSELEDRHRAGRRRRARRRRSAKDGQAAARIDHDVRTGRPPGTRRYRSRRGRGDRGFPARAIERGRSEGRDRGDRRATGREQPQGHGPCDGGGEGAARSEENTSELQSLMRISSAVYCLKKKQLTTTNKTDKQ